MSRRFLAVVVSIALCGVLLPALAGCGDTTPTTLPPIASTTTVPDVGYVDLQPVDLESIVNLANGYLSDAEKQVLARQSFVAVIAPAEEAARKFWMIYENARYQGLPVLITTDSLLNAYHGLFDTIMQRVEEAALYDQAIVMTQELYDRARSQWMNASDQGIKAEARLNMAYFATAQALLDPATTAPAGMQTEVQAETALIYAAEGPEESPILGYVEDYSQYKPRGHYTRSEKLQQYFRAMMWYGHTAFFINPRDPDITEQEAMSLTRRAILISSSLSGTAEEAWRSIYEPTSFLVGAADDLTLNDMATVVTQVFGTSSPSPDSLADAALVSDVREGLNALPAPRILTAPMPESDAGADPESNERSFRVMGQRYIPDSYAFQQLVWNHVGTPDNKRTMPMGLDIMTVLGSDEAYKLETGVYAQNKYDNWGTQVQKVTRELAQTGSEFWPNSLYTGWLEALQEIYDMPAEGSPEFMRTRPWALKSLNTTLGSWTELRHDTILYAKQSVVAEGEGGEEEISPGYVEPYPAFYDKIAELADSLDRGLDAYDLLDLDSADRLSRMAKLSRELSTIAQKELDGTALSDDEVYLIVTYGQVLESLEQFVNEEDGFLISPAPEKSPIVADVHSDYISSPPLALEEATGYPLYLYVAFELDGVLQLFVGASYSYYEFTAPVDQRLTDEEWVVLLDSGQANEYRPSWSDAWIVQR